jgi:hypothetical protein
VIVHATLILNGSVEPVFYSGPGLAKPAIAMIKPWGPEIKSSHGKPWADALVIQ